MSAFNEYLDEQSRDHPAANVGDFNDNDQLSHKERKILTKAGPLETASLQTYVPPSEAELSAGETSMDSLEKMAKEDPLFQDK